MSKISIMALQLKRLPTELSVGFILVCNITEDTTILTVTNGSSISRPKNFFCCSLVPLAITGVCCEGRDSHLYFTCHTNKLLHKLKNMQAYIQKIYSFTEYGKTLTKSINFCMVFGTTVNTADMKSG